MITVAQLIAELQNFPPDALAYAYEGEVTGIVIVEATVTEYAGGGKGREELGVIETREPT